TTPTRALRERKKGALINLYTAKKKEQPIVNQPQMTTNHSTNDTMTTILITLTVKEREECMSTIKGNSTIWD
ncbi:18927_t:CDS:2, partial [Gigaspora rosea]